MATRGRLLFGPVAYAAWTEATKSASSRMDRRRFSMLRLERLRAPRMREKLWLACSEKIRSFSDRFAIFAARPAPGCAASASL